MQQERVSTGESPVIKCPIIGAHRWEPGERIQMKQIQLSGAISMSVRIPLSGADSVECSDSIEWSRFR